MDAVSIASSIAGLVAIADTIFSRIYSVYKYTKAVQGAAKEIEELATGIRTLSELLHGLQLLLSQFENDLPDPSLRMHHINSCRQTLLKIQKKLDSHDPHTSDNSSFEKTIRKLKWPFSSSEAKELLAEVDRHKATINVALTGDSLASILRGLTRQDQMAEDIKRLKAAQEEKWAMETHIAITAQRKKVLDFFGKVDPASHHRTNLKLHHPLTGLWLTEGDVFKTWLQNRNSKMWLSGIPGAGKTVLAACVIEEALKESNESHAVAYFYCDYKDVNTQEPVKILSSIAAQLARQNEDAFTYLEELYNSTCHDDAGHGILEMSELVKIVVLQTSTFEDVSMIVDGLDECSSRATEAVSSLLHLCSDTGSNVRVILLSRAEYEIDELLHETFFHVDIAAQSEDLKLYAESQIDSRERLVGREQLRIRNQELKQHIIKTLVDGAHGMFRWVACQLDLLSKLPTDAAKRKALSSLPPTLFKTYERILERINESGPEIQVMVQRSLLWIFNTEFSGIPTTAVCEAISINGGEKLLDMESICEKEDILMHCSSLIRLSSCGRYFELAHFTVKEFLSEVSSSPIPSLAIYSQEECKVLPYLAKTCLTYILLGDFQGEVIEDYDDWEEQQSQYPFRAHAVGWWVDYAENIWDDDTLQCYAHTLFNPCSKTYQFLSWARDYIYVCSWGFLNEEGTREDTFVASTEFICEGGVMPLHIAAAIGNPELCRWLIELGCAIDQMSSMGSPVHCALLGIYRFSNILNDSQLLAPTTSFMEQGRADVLDLLIKLNADLTLPYTDLEGKDYSCAKLALHAGTRQGAEHPLIKLIASGAQLDDSLLTSFPEFFKKRANMCTTSPEENSPNQELIAALIPILNETSQNELALNELLTIFQFQDLAHANGSMDIEQLQEMLDRAIRFDQKEVVERLSRETSFDVAARHGDQGETALHRAAEYDSIHTIGLLKSLGLDINATTNSGLTPLHYAAAYASRTETVIKLLLEHGASTTITDIRGRTVLHVAVEFGDVIGLKTLLALDKESSSTLLLPEKSGFIPLFYAAMNRQADTCEYLLSRVENFTDLQPWCPDGLGLVHYAVSMNSLKLLQLVQEKGGRLDQRTADGRNGLHFIPEAVDIRIVDSLLETGLQPTMVADDGATPLHTLIQAGQQLEHKLFDILATQETIRQQDEKGYTVLHCSVSSRPGCCVQKFNYENRNRAFEILVKKGADVHSKTLEGQSCLQLLFKLRQNELKHQKHCCKKAGRSSKAFVDLFTSVITHITDLDILHGCLLAEDGFSFRPINWALSVKEYELANALYSKGVDIDLQNTGSKQMNRAWSALETAAFHGCTSALFGLLLERSKRRHALDERGFSLVHYVCKEGSGDNFELLEILCGHGFDFNLRSTEDADTPLILATIAGKRAHVQFLLKHGVDYRSRTKYGWEAIHHAARNENLNIFEEFIGLNMDWEDNCVDVLTQQHSFLPKCNILHLAAICARKDLIYLITEKSLIGDINCWNGSGYSPLHLASCLATFDTVNALLVKGADINLEGPGQIRAIHLAAVHKGLDVINLMLSQNCLLLPDATGMTPEMYALKHGRKDNVDRLRSYAQEKQMSESASRGVHTSDSSMATGLALAIQLGDLALCKSVVSAGTTIPDSLSSCGDCNPILLALLYQRWEIAQYLITRGASTTGQLCSRWELRGYSAVHLASIQPSSSSLLRILLKKDLEAGNLSFQGPVNPVHVAVAHNNIAGLRVLLQHAEAQNWAQKAKTRDESLSSEVINHAGVNIHTASSPSFSLLGKNGSLCDVKISSQLKWTWKLGSLRIKRFCGAGAMHIAAEIDSVESVKALLEYGATIDCINIFNQTPAHIAALMRHSQLLYLLNQYGSNMNLQYFGRTTAMFAVAGGLALNTNGWVTIEWSDCDQKGSSILHYAGSGNPIMLSSLLEMGCDPYSTNTDGYTAIELAIRTSITSPALLSICLNWDLDFDRCIICIWSIFSQSDHTDFADTRQQRILKRLFRRLPTTRVRRELNTIPTRGSIRETPLVQAARGGEPQILDLLVQAGAALDLEGGPQSTPLLTACKEGRLSSVVHLVRMGAKVFSSRNGREYTAVQAAAWFPKIIRWLLVERYTDQTKICWESAENVEREIVAWQGPMTVEVAIAGLYSATHGASSFEKTKDLAEFRRDFRGKVVYLEGLHSLVSSIIPTTA